MLLGVSAFLLYHAGDEVKTYFAYSNTIALAQQEKEELIALEEELMQEIINLNDVEYIIRYARGKYLATKDDGDQVFIIPEDDE